MRGNNDIKTCQSFHARIPSLRPPQANAHPLLWSTHSAFPQKACACCQSVLCCRGTSWNVLSLSLSLSTPSHTQTTAECNSSDRRSVSCWYYPLPKSLPLSFLTKCFVLSTCKLFYGTEKETRALQSHNLSNSPTQDRIIPLSNDRQRFWHTAVEQHHGGSLSWVHAEVIKSSLCEYSTVWGYFGASFYFMTWEWTRHKWNYLTTLQLSEEQGQDMEDSYGSLRTVRPNVAIDNLFHSLTDGRILYGYPSFFPSSIKKTMFNLNA